MIEVSLDIIYYWVGFITVWLAACAGLLVFGQWTIENIARMTGNYITLGKAVREYKAQQIRKRRPSS